MAEEEASTVHEYYVQKIEVIFYKQDGFYPYRSDITKAMDKAVADHEPAYALDTWHEEETDEYIKLSGHYYTR